jgi:hypothetical protein
VKHHNPTTIVKIQRSQSPSQSGRVLVYNCDRRYLWQGQIDPRVDKWMGDKQKAYAYAHIENSEIVIDHEAPWQDW